MLLRNLAVACLLACGTGLALAQTVPSAPSSPGPSSPRAPVADAPLGDVFISPAALDLMWRNTDLAGQPVYNLQDEKVGKIDEILFDPDGRIAAMIVGVGGVFGLGKKNVAVAFKAFRLTRDDNGSAKLMLDIARPTLESAPDYAPAKGRNPG